MDTTEENARLESIASESKYGAGVNASTIAHSARVFSRYWRGERCLEMGPAEGIMTPYLDAAFPHLALLEGSAKFCTDLTLRFPKARVVQSLFETAEFGPEFDTVVLGHVLEHVGDPLNVLRRAAGWLAPGGVVCAAVPNARSLHRQGAVIMGMLETEHTLNDTDHYHGHRRVYDPESFRNDFRASGLDVEVFGGYWLKPVSNAQIEATWTPSMVEAFMVLGERYPDIAAEIYVIARKRT